MKSKQLFALLTAFALTASLLTACGASSNTMAMDQARPEAAPMEEPMADMKYEMADEVLYSSASTTGSTSANIQTGQKLIRKINIDAETEDLEALLPGILEQVARLGGYVENQELYNGSAYSSYRHRSASLTIRIPADKLDGFVQQVKDISNVVTYNESQDDVTLTYVSTESRIKALETEQERLLELLSKAENMSDLLEIEARLTDVRYELENVTSQLRVLTNKVDYATVYLYIDQVKVYTEVEEQNVWQRIASGFRQNLEDIGEDAEDFFVWVVTYSPQLLVWALVAGFAIALLRRKGQKARKKRAENVPFQTKDQNTTQEQ